MKKIILSLLIGLVSVLTFLPLASAVELPPSNPNSKWTLESFEAGGTTYFYMSLALQFPQYSVTEINITIPDNGYSVDTISTFNSSFRFQYEGGTVASVNTSSLTDLLADGGSISFDLDTESYTYMGSTVSMEGIWQSTSFYAMVYLSFTGVIPGGLTVAQVENLWKTYGSMSITGYILEIAFFSQLVYYDSLWVGSETVIDNTLLPTPPSVTGYDFLCWKTKTGDVFDVNTPVSSILEEWLTTIDGYSVLYLYASFISESGDEYTYLPPSAGSPDGLTGIFASIGWDNDAGYFIVFTVLVFLVVVGMALFHLPTFVILIVAAALAFLFFFLGWIPLFAFIIVLLIIAVGLVFSLTRGGAVNE